jgi:RimJ/RimL family protein N-acetyltransferase
MDNSIFLELKPVNIYQDLELILAWRSNPLIFEYFLVQDKPLSWEEHQYYWSQIDNRFDYVIFYEGRRIGYFSLRKNSKSRFEVSILIGEIRLWGTGLGSVSLKKGIQVAKEKNIEILIANIHKMNSKSIRLFEKVGFKKEFTQLDNNWLTYSLPIKENEK